MVSGDFVHKSLGVLTLEKEWLCKNVVEEGQN